MSDRIIPHAIVAAQFEISPNSLLRYEQLGLIESVRDQDVIGFELNQVQRIWSIVTYQRDLGVNLAGVEVLLKMRDQRDHLQRILTELGDELAGLIEQDSETELHA
jgi:MerR family transcriptional regulator/heat shock protein HspR